MYAIVDIETTGGHADSNGITEVAIYVFDGTKIVREFSSLVNPGVPIPPFLERYTGITNEMVSTAPFFKEIAPEVFDLLKDNIFVAHNVNFDYSFLHHQLGTHGFRLDTQKLCTVRLSRKVFEGHKSYSLGNICAALGIPISNRHRAAGDAFATVQLFAAILKKDESSILETFLKKGSKEYNLPPNLPREQFDVLPQRSGVYYFHDSQGKVVYVGKAKNIKQRVGSHFSGNGTGKQKQDFLRAVFGVSFQECATELMSLIMEATEIRKHWPEFNRALKKIEFHFALYHYQDQNDFVRLAVERVRKHLKPLYTFRTQVEAIHALQHLVKEYQLCPRMCLIHHADQPVSALDSSCCKGACERIVSADDYNQRVERAVDSLVNGESYAVVDKGLYADEYSCVLVEKGRFYGMGYIPIDTNITDLDQLKQFITPHKDSFYVREVIESEVMRGKGSVVSLT
jgi:DNA polymerase-3 subunit epsilon